MPPPAPKKMKNNESKSLENDLITVEGVDDEMVEEMRRMIKKKKKGSNNRMVICRDCPGQRSIFYRKHIKIRECGRKKLVETFLSFMWVAFGTKLRAKIINQIKKKKMAR